MARYVLDVRYDGTAFHGSQIQGEIATVQKAVNDALAVLLRKPVESFGASRTDESVHGLSNFYHFDEDEILHPQFQYKLNAILPAGLALNTLYRANSDSFNARFDAMARQYRYRIHYRKDPFKLGRAFFFPYQFNRQVLDKTAARLLKHTDYESFCKRNAQTHTFLCTVKRAFWEEVGDELHFVVEANRFLRGMVRGLVGTQLRAARHNSEAEFESTLLAKDCTKADFSVPGWGLYLEKLTYPEGMLIPIKDERPFRKSSLSFPGSPE
jgi:tRNA pseudouridine38-40 synthase